MRRDAASQLRYNSAATRHVSDTEKLVPARTAAAPSYGFETARRAMLRECSMSQRDTSWPATAMSQMSHFPDTKNAVLATMSVTSQIRTGHTCCYLSAIKTLQVPVTPLWHPVQQVPSPRIPQPCVCTTPAAQSACQPQPNPLGLLFPTHLGGIWYGCHWSGHR